MFIVVKVKNNKNKIQVSICRILEAGLGAMFETTGFNCPIKTAKQERTGR